MVRRRKAMLVVHDLADVPDFETDVEEAAYWDTHMVSPNLARRLPTDDGDLPPTRSLTDRYRAAVRSRVHHGLIV